MAVSRPCRPMRCPASSLDGCSPRWALPMFYLPLRKKPCDMLPRPLRVLGWRLPARLLLRGSRQFNSGIFGPSRRPRLFCALLLLLPSTGEDLRADWLHTFRPEAPAASLDFAAAWRGLADEARLTSAVSLPFAVSYQDFVSAVARSSGAPGLDGWTAREVKWLLAHCPQLIRELYEILCAAVVSPESTSRDAEAWSCFFSWRLVGVPKRDADAVRPVAVGSVLLRAWQRSLLGMFLTCLMRPASCWSHSCRARLVVSSGSPRC